MRNYGLTPEQLEEMATAQGRRCAACRDILDMGKKTHVDHDHATGRVRGLLCQGCSCALGWVKERVDALNGLVRYIEQNRRHLAVAQ